MIVGVGVEPAGDGFITLVGILMVDIDVVDVTEEVIFDVVGLEEVNSDEVVDSGYSVNTSLR